MKQLELEILADFCIECCHTDCWVSSDCADVPGTKEACLAAGWFDIQPVEEEGCSHRGYCPEHAEDGRFMNEWMNGPEAVKAVEEFEASPVYRFDEPKKRKRKK